MDKFSKAIDQARFQELHFREGVSLSQCHRILNAGRRGKKISKSTLKAWKDQINEEGAIKDRRTTNSGRKPDWEYTQEEILALRRLNYAKEGLPFAVEFFINDPACRPETRAHLLASMDKAAAARKPWRPPLSLQRVAHVPAGVRAYLDGPKASLAARPSTACRLTWRGVDRVERPISPFDIIVMDDCSTNEPYWLRYAEEQHPRCCRQTLSALDMATNAWLYADMIGREKDAYTAADVINAIRHTILAHGTKPRILILEKGRWKSNLILGLPMENGGRWGSIEEAGIVLHYGYDPRHKREIEGYFRIVQRWMGQSSADIGRNRGHHEREQAMMVKVNQGKLDPVEAGFIHITTARDNHEATMSKLNARPRRRKALGEYVSADDLMNRWPHIPRPLLDEERWLFHPVKMEGVVREGAVYIGDRSIAPHGLVFRVNGPREGVYLDNGHRVFLAFDPFALAVGDLCCVVGNRETGSLNRKNYRLGEIILHARYEGTFLGEQPRVDLSRPTSDEDRSESWKDRKRHITTMRTEGVAIAGRGKKAMRVSSAVNRSGDRVQLISNGPAPSQSDTAPAEVSPPSGRLRSPQPATSDADDDAWAEAQAAKAAEHRARAAEIAKLY